MVSSEAKGKKFKNEGKSSTTEMKGILADSRFAHIVSDPKYKNVSTKKLKVKIDKRFKSVLTQEHFNVKPVLDPRGRPKSYGTKEGLNKYYELQSSDSESNSESEDNKESEIENKLDDKSKDHIQSTKKITKNNKKLDTKIERKNWDKEYMASLLNPEKDLARGDTFYSDDSSDDDSSTTEDDEPDEDEVDEFEWGELDGDAKWDVDGNEVEETNRFAVCDMDWDRIKPVDLLILFSSFMPLGGAIKKVSTYLSEFGKKRLQEEERLGPQEIVNLTVSQSKDDAYKNLEKIKKGIFEDTDDIKAHEKEALRKYQRNRLKYYYAVVECDTVETATAIYKECDRSLYKGIGVTMDLRYIPSDMEFNEAPRDVCEKIPPTYESDVFQLTSYLDSNPTLTWDETDHRRKKVLTSVMSNAMKKKNFESNDLKDFIADSESDEEEKDEEGSSEDEGGNSKESKDERAAKFRALLATIDDKMKKKEELTFDMEDDFDIEEKGSEDEGGDKSGSEGDAEESEKEGEEEEEEKLTPFEKYLVKRKEKRKERKRMKKMGEEKENEDSEDEGSHESESPNKNKDNVQESTDKNLALIVMDEEEEDKRHFDMRKIKKMKESQGKKKRKWNKTEEGEEEEEEIIDNFKVDSSDSRFAALFSQGNFNLDPSHPKYDKHSSLNHNVIQKQKKIKPNQQADDQQMASTSLMDNDVSGMIRRFKMKTAKLK